MAENTNQSAGQGQQNSSEKQAGKGLTVGKPAPASITDFSSQSQAQGGESAKNNNEGAGGTGGATGGTQGAVGSQSGTGNEGAGGAQGGAQGSGAAPEIKITDEKVKAYLEEKGIKFDGTTDSLAELIKNANAPQKKELTAEEKKAADEALEKRVIARYIENQGKIEDYVALKQLADADAKELSISELRRELKDAKFSDDQINAIIKERYYQVDDTELEQLSEETERQLLQKKKEYGSKKLESRSSYLKQKAESVLKELRDAIVAEDLLRQKEEEFSSKVDENLSKLPRKITFQLGDLEGQTIPPIDFDVTDADLADITETLKDPAKRKQFFFNEDNTLNITNIAQIMARNKILEAAVKASYFEGGNRTISKLKETFPAHAHELGIGGPASKPNGTKGKFASAGKPVVAKPQTK